MVKIKDIEITSSFWQRYRKLIAEKAVPFQWKMISDQEKPEVVSETTAGGAADKSNAIANFKIAAGQLKGKHHGMIFQDTDVYKWLETVAYVLQYKPSDKLKKLADKVIDLIGEAQDEDGYLSTRYQIDTPDLKFRQLQQSHELYSMGHYIEAGVAYYQSTGNQKALTIARKMADCIDQHFGNEKGKIKGYDGHPEIELALSKLYDCTQDKKYLDLANYFVEVRGTQPNFFAEQNSKNDIKYDPFPDMRHASENYFFDKLPVTEQKAVQGHAVRVLYYLTGVAHVARLTNNSKLMKAAEYLWQDITQKQMYITGNVGQTANGEAFTYDYDLPNKTDYGETCASVAMVMFARQMELMEENGKYGDIIEREIYNGALAGISLDGEHYFYANALEISKNSHLNPASAHLSMKRLSWFSCACCPANITRLIASIDKYIYIANDKYILLDQLISNKVLLDHGLKVEVKSDLPWEGKVQVRISNPNNYRFEFKIRIPSWSKNYKITINEKESNVSPENGIITIPIETSEVIDLDLSMTAYLVHANPKVVEDQGKVAISRGPIIYCSEQVDNKGDYSCYSLPTTPQLTTEYRPDLLKGIEEVKVNNAIYKEEKDLYSSVSDDKSEERQLTLVPYYAWANRTPGSMNVWFKQEGK